MANILNKIPGKNKNTDLVTISILSDGNEIGNLIQVLSVSVQKEINRIPVATIVLIDGDAASQEFTSSNEDYFIPGKEIEIKAGYHSDEATIFKGIVIQHNLRIRESTSRLVIQCKDIVFESSTIRKNRLFEESLDSDAIENIFSDYNFDVNVAATNVEHQELVQFNSSDWDFVLSRADVNAMVCMVNDGTLTIEAPDLKQAALFDCVFGVNILDFDAEIDASNQFDGTLAKAWDFSTQEIIEAEGKEPAFSGTGNISVSEIASSINQAAYDMYHSGNIKADELQAWADSKLLHSRLSQVRGRVKIQGTEEALPGIIIKLGGVGDRFNGEVYVSGVHHQIVDGNWTSNIQLGLSENWFADLYNINNPPASGLLPAVKGLQNGIVTQLEDDPEGEERIKVRFPIIDPAADGIWCRLSCLDAGNERGTYFRPEVNDEVIVGFINDDPRDAIILGMLHSSVLPSPESITADNFKKGYLSREKLKLDFDDEKKIITIETPSGNIVVLDEDMGGIKMEDQNGNKIIMDSSGILIESAKDIILKTTSGDVNMEGINVSAKAQSSLTVEGSASAEISSGGTATVKGSLVQIN